MVQPLRLRLRLNASLRKDVRVDVSAAGKLTIHINVETFADALTRRLFSSTKVPSLALTRDKG